MVPVRLRYNVRELKYRIEHALRRGYTETLPDGMHVFLNPYATNASPIGPFKGREIAFIDLTWKQRRMMWMHQMDSCFRKPGTVLEFV
jgi:hypothetical protein